MEGPKFKLISQNIASSHRLERITDVLKREKPDLFLIQEVTVSTIQLQAAIEPFMYKCESNTDNENPSAPGTAAIWKINLPTPQVTNLVSCNLQTVSIGPHYFYNVYAPSGSENRRDRALLFTRDIFPHLLQHQKEHRPT